MDNFTSKQRHLDYGIGNRIGLDGEQVLPEHDQIRRFAHFHRACFGFQTERPGTVDGKISQCLLVAYTQCRWLTAGLSVLVTKLKPPFTPMNS